MFLGEAMKALAIDLGGSHATCAIVDDTRILISERINLDSAQSLESVLPLFSRALHNLLHSANLQASDCEGLALGSCGLVDSAGGRFLSMNQKYDDAPKLDVAAWCRREFGLRFRLENDARMALLGERYAGCAIGASELCMMTLGTGIGAAAMIEGKLLRGKHFQAGNLGGHVPVVFNGRPCTCGGIGCAESEAGGWAIPGIAREWPGFAASALAAEPKINFEALFRLAGQGDRVSRELRDRCIHIWAATAVALVHSFDPEWIVIGGGVMRSGNQILPFIQDWLDRHTWTSWGKVQVRAAVLGNDAGLLGAIPLLRE
jgi:glucokinase